jgi:hypothetical protein
MERTGKADVRCLVTSNVGCWRISDATPINLRSPIGTRRWGFFVGDRQNTSQITVPVPDDTSASA